MTSGSSLGPLSRNARIARVIAVLAYAAWFMRSYRHEGFPFDRERVIGWIAGALLITAIGRPWRRYAQVLVDWLPFGVLLYFYDSSRGLADDLGRPVVVEPLVAIDRWLFFGRVPADAVQHGLLTPGAGVGWWELGISIVYASHFVVPFVFAGVLWWRSRHVWRRWVNRFVMLSVGAVLTYALLPTGPPWYAGELGLMPAVDRPVQRGWAKVSVHAAPAWFARGRDVANAYAAVPSLHAGYSFLLALFVFRLVGRERGPWRWLLFAYPAAMAFTLVYGGEHFVIDILAGWAYALAACALCDRAGARFARRRRRRAATDDAPVVTDDQVGVYSSGSAPA